MKRNQTKHAFAVAALAAAMAAASPAHAADAVASMGSVTIKPQEVQALLQAMPADARAAAKANRPSLEGWLRQQLALRAVVQEAQGKGWDKKADIKQQIDIAVRDTTDRVIMTSYLESVSTVPSDYPSDAELRTAYDQAKDNFQLPPTYHMAQIFIAAQPGDAAAVAKARAQIQQIALDAKAGDFSDLARKNSQDTQTGPQGGDVGTMPLAQVFPEARDPISKLRPGQVTDPIQSAIGFHLVKLIDINPGRVATLEEVRPRLQAMMRQQRQQEQAQAYMAKLAPAASMKIDGAALDAVLK